MNAKFERTERHFSSLEECVNYIKLHYDPGATIRVQTKDIESDEMVPLDVPAYLYRGEKGSFPSTTSSMSRMKGDTLLSKHTREVIENVALKLDSGLQEFMQFNQMYSSGFLQHYGAPTELLDITSDLKVAAFFASEGRAGDTGLMCTFPVAVISKNSVTIDLREHPGAERPRRQSAFGFFNRKYVDIKDQKCIQELQLHWFSFTLQQTDKSLYHSDGHLLDAHTDKVAGMTAEFAKKHHKPWIHLAASDQDICSRLSGDLSPLASLTSLQSLNLSGCGQLEGDLAPLAGLTFKTLDLSYCRGFRRFGPLELPG
jgi:hypothetical protein